MVMEFDTRWTKAALQEAWGRMFDYSFYTNHYEHIDVQMIFMLLEGGLRHVKNLGTAYSKMKVSEKELKERLQEKTDECRSLRKELKRLSKACTKCTTLEAAVVDAERRAKEVQSRMDSIANILKLGEREPSQSARRNAIDLVSQMILGSSPPSKRKKLTVEPVTPEKEEILAADSSDIQLEKKNCDENAVIPATVPASPVEPSPTRSPCVSSVKERTIARSPIIEVNFIPGRRRNRDVLSKSSDPPGSNKSPNVKKNLTLDFEKGVSVVEASPNRKGVSVVEASPNKPVVFDLKQGLPPLDDTLKEYVKDCTGELLENIWFNDDENDVFVNKDQPVRTYQKKEVASSSPSAVIAETPCPKQKKADFWLLKDKRGAGEISKLSGRKMRQLKLELGFKKVESKVDLSKLPAVHSSDKEDDEIIATSPGAPLSKKNLEKCVSQSEEADVNTTDFRPLASSTQKPKAQTVDEYSRSTKPSVSDFDRLPTKASSKEPDYVYARDAIKKKSERMKLEGWECKECAEYYATVGKDMDAAELKKRMNACSRHRNKFKPQLDLTPPAFWNPVFPETQERKGYTSIYEKDN